MDRDRLHRLLHLGFEKGASDIHFQVGYLPLYRFTGELVELRYRVLTIEDTESIARLLLEGSHYKSLDGINEADLAYEIPGEGRFRVNICRERRSFNIVLRVIPIEIKGFDDLNLPSVLRDISATQRGLVLVTGATGMGKSTTMATMIQEIARSHKCKILTVEDPVEFLFRHEKAIITQREIGTDTENFPAALKAALRQDPDVIMVGEMRDAATVDTALKAAETGHAVFASIHTSDAMTTIGRLLSFFPPEEQIQVRDRLAEALQAIVCLRLLPNKKGDGRIPAVEVMRMTRTIRECIRDPARTSEIPGFIARGREDLLMQTFDQHLLDLYKANKIRFEAACEAASNPQDFATQVALEGDEDPELDDQASEQYEDLEDDGRF
jgi:twitching motility protein PilT